MDHMKHLIWIVLVLLISCHTKENNAALKAIQVKYAHPFQQCLDSTLHQEVFLTHLYHDF